MKPAFLFDLDFTLYDARKFYEGAFREICLGLGTRHQLDHEALYEQLMECWTELTSRHPYLLEHFLKISELPLEELPTVLEVLYRHQPPLELYPDARQFLDSVGEDTNLGIVADGHGQIQRAKIRALDLTRRFDPIVLTSDYGPAWKKPSPLPFQAACHTLGRPPEEVIYVGDNPYDDALGAIRAGMTAVRIRRGEYESHSPPSARFFATEIESLTDLLAEGFLEQVNVRAAG